MKIKKEINKKLFAGEWIFSECERMSYKLDKEGRLIFNCSDEVTEDEKYLFTVEALVHLGVEKEKARAIVNISEGIM